MTHETEDDTMPTFRNVGGEYTDEKGRTYRDGEIVSSPRDLDRTFRNKFVRLSDRETPAGASNRCPECAQLDPPVTREFQSGAALNDHRAVYHPVTGTPKADPRDVAQRAREASDMAARLRAGGVL